MKKRLFAMSCIAVCAAVIFSGCNVIKTEISNPITEIFDENGVDYRSFSEPAQQALYEINADHFFEAELITYETQIAEIIDGVRDIFSEATSNSMEVSALTNALFEDIIIQYDVSVANANAASAFYAVEKYCNKCSENNIVVKPGVHIYKIASKSSKKAVKYSGSDSDLRLFINDVINKEARNGYCYINVNEYGAPVSVYWSANKSGFDKEDELKSYYIWDTEKYQNGDNIIGSNLGKYNIVNTMLHRTIEKTTLADIIQTDTYGVGKIDNRIIYENLRDIFIREIDEWENYFESLDSETSDVTYTKVQYEDMESSNAYAKQVHTALSACATLAAIDNITIGSSEITNNYDGDLNLLFGDFDPDLKSYLGESFKGYYYVYLNPETYSVYFALWSEQPIPDSYKYQLTADEQKQMWANDIRIGCYPLAWDEASAYKNTNVSYSGGISDSIETSKAVIDPFENLEIQYDGASPYLKASVNTSNCRDEVKKYVTFSVTDEPLRKGDTVTVNADWDENGLSDQKITFSAKSKDYKIENSAYYIDSAEGVDLAELDQLMDDYVEAEANKSVNNSSIYGKASHNETWYHGEPFTIGYNPIITGIGSQKAVKKYLISLKQPSSLESDKIFNKYICIYEVDYNTYRSATDESASGTATIAVFMDNIVMNTDGNLKYNSSEPLSAGLLYYKAENTISILESNYIIAEKANYNVTQIN